MLCPISKLSSTISWKLPVLYKINSAIHVVAILTHIAQIEILEICLKTIAIRNNKLIAKNT